MILVDLLYLLVAAVLSPWLLWRALATGRYRQEMTGKLLGSGGVANPSGRPVAWFHGVSVGEIHLLATLVSAFRQRHQDWLIVVSSTTDTGLTEARNRFRDGQVIAFPLDFSWSVNRTLDAVNPTVIVLAESELWPNFLASAARRRITVVVANARVSPRTFSRMRRLRRLVDPLLLRPVSAFAAQTEETAERLRQLGVTADRVVVTGSVKYDGATAAASGTAMATMLGLPPDTRVWVAGSTHAPEESIVLDVFSRLRSQFPDLRLILVPRHPDRFGEVAKLVEGSGLSNVRWSTITTPLPRAPAVILLDTIGKLGEAWALADVGFTGGSLDGHRGGQSMIEPAGYGVPVCFGPHIWNFRDAARLLVEVGGARMVRDAKELERETAGILADGSVRTQMGTAARELVRAQQGATIRTLDLIDKLLASSHPSPLVADRPTAN